MFPYQKNCLSLQQEIGRFNISCMDLKFFNKVKSLFEESGYTWHEEPEDGFLWCDQDRGTGVAWIFYLHADCLKVIIGFNGFHRAAASFNERSFIDLYHASNGKGSSLQDITKGDLTSMLGRLFEKAIDEIQKHKPSNLPINAQL